MDRTDLKIAVVATQEKTRSISYQIAGPIGRFFYRVFHIVFDREKTAVHHGIASYYRGEDRAGQRYKVRRNVHMIEKGLCMRPRRATFAADYIEATVAELAKLNTTEAFADVEYRWARDVLDEYFSATATSSSPRISSARTMYSKLPRRIESDGLSRPYAVGDVKSPVAIESLAILADQRTSVRWYDGQHVDRGIVDAAIEVALQAPTACNRVAWSLRIFDDPTEASRIASIAMGTRGFADQIPGVAVLVGNLGAYFNERDRHLIYIDGSLAAMSFVFGLQAQGVSSCCINWPDIPAREKRMADALGLAPHERVVMLVSYGYADPEGLTPYSAKTRLDQVRTFHSQLPDEATTT